MCQAPRWSGLSIIVLGLTLSMVAFCLSLGAGWKDSFAILNSYFHLRSVMQQVRQTTKTMEFRSLKDSFAILITFVMCPLVIVSMCSLQFWKLLLKLFGAYIQRVALRPFSFLSPNSMCSDDVYESDSAHEYCNASHKCHDMAGAEIFRIWHPCIIVIWKPITRITLVIVSF